MKTNNIFSACIISIIIAIGISGCEQDNPIDKEQYKKQISIVGAQHNSNGYSTFDLRCKDDGYSEAFVSVAVSGSLRPDKDIIVRLSDDVPGAIDEYNRIYVSSSDIKNRPMPSSAYEIPDYNVIIKAGDTYGNLPVNIRTTDLECDSVYALPFRIVSVSQYDYRRVDTVLIMAINLVNDYSDSYRLDAYQSTVQNDGKLTDSVSMMGQKLTLKAISEKVVRFFGEGVIEEKDNIASHCITLTVNDDNTVNIAAWDVSKLTIKSGSGSYDPQKRIFYLKWNYIKGGVEYQVGGTMINQKALLTN
ncbi:MAG: DUF4361 domain-containing protein [Prevotella sp.]|jgi:hypothetical protein|nr:DUF4361 domain-containing protein [Prevotella sp.]